MKADLIFNPPERTETTGDAIARLLLRSDLTRLRMAVAFASAEGAQILLGLIQARNSPLDVKLVIGLDGLVTEPEAIKILAAQFARRVRLFETSGEGIFHAKTLALDGKTRTSPFVVAVGSSNLTSAGLSKNREANIMMEFTPGVERNRIARQWQDWFDQMWGLSKNVTNAQIQKYEARYKIRRRMPAPDRNKGSKIEVSKIKSASARDLWIESGAVTGGAANQLEIPSDAVAFFGINPNKRRSQITLRLFRGASVWNNSVMAYYQSNSMWRIRLDTTIPDVSNAGIRFKVLHFRRSAAGNNYEFNVLLPAQAYAMKATSRASGNIGSTITRSYGWL